MRRLAAYILSTCALVVFLQQREVATQVNTVKELAPGVYFHEGDIKGKGHCNNGWVVFDDYVLVVDANFPSGAREIIPKIQAQTKKPIRFAFDTHHHGDHAYGNQVWAEQGATLVAQENVVSEMRKYETALFGGKPGRWEDTAKQREDVRGSKLKAPSLLYRDTMIFDDGTHRVELRYFGIGHTHGDGYAWLPKERILFTGDAAVNGPWNYMADGDSGAWIETLAKAQALGATIVAPGHGPAGTGAVVQAQRDYFVALRAEVEKRKDLAPDRVKADVRAIRDALLPRHATYIDTNATTLDGFEAHVAKVYREMTGKDLPQSKALEAERMRHDRHHGLTTSVASR
jgi:glyoxylase-like metal-dependent hydrolase (beta-lactamase superfamily II)